MSFNWVEAADIAARLGQPGAGSDALAIITAAIPAAQAWVESHLRSKLDQASQTEVFHLSSRDFGHTQFQGMFVLRTRRKFLTAATLTVYDDMASYLLGGGVAESVITSPFLDKDNGFYRVQPELDGKVLVLAYTAGFPNAAAVPVALKDAVVAYLPTILQFSQVTNDDTANYKLTIEKAREHARDILSLYCNVTYPNAVRPL